MTERRAPKRDPWDLIQGPDREWLLRTSSNWTFWCLLTLLMPVFRWAEPPWIPVMFPSLAVGVTYLGLPGQSRRAIYWMAAVLWSVSLLVGRSSQNLPWTLDAVWVALFPFGVAFMSESAVQASCLTGVHHVPFPGVLDARCWKQRPAPGHLLDSPRSSLPHQPGPIATDSTPSGKPDDRLVSLALLGLDGNPDRATVDAAHRQAREALESRRPAMSRGEWVRERMRLERAYEQVRCENHIETAAERPVPEDGKLLWEAAVSGGDGDHLDRVSRYLFHQHPELIRPLLTTHRDLVARAIAREDPTALPVWGIAHLSAFPRAQPEPVHAVTPAPVTVPVPTRATAVNSRNEGVIGHMGSLKYHGQGCPHGERITSRNRQAFRDEDEAIDAGYEPCQVCDGYPM